MSYSFLDNGLASSALFREITDSVNIHYRQEEMIISILMFSAYYHISFLNMGQPLPLRI